MGKESTARTYEDYAVGQRVECPGARRITDSDRSAWIGLVGDPIPRFSDDAERVHPLLVFNLAHGMVTAAVLAGSREALGFSAVVPHRPVVVGTVLHATCRVIGAREDAGGEAGVIWVRVAARDPRGVVLSYVHWFRVPKRHRQAAGPRDALPTLGDKVQTRDIHTGSLGELPRSYETGGRFTFEDYLAGETLFHGPATVIEAHDIRSFARWFRIDRDVHHLPDLKTFRAPEGLVLGAAYALCHDGLRNRAGLGGINALRTPNAVRAGDVLRVMSQVVAVEPLSPTVGAVRLRTYLFRNRVPMGDDPPLVTNGKRYYEHIALDMDYWELLPTREGQSGRR